jgi:hypothetical protein
VIQRRKGMKWNEGQKKMGAVQSEWNPVALRRADITDRRRNKM